jgi:hypothetical protein
LNGRSRIVRILIVAFESNLAGILFQDITTLLLDTKAFRDTIDLFVERYKDKGISVVAGIISYSVIYLFIIIIIDFDHLVL